MTETEKGDAKSVYEGSLQLREASNHKVLRMGRFSIGGGKVEESFGAHPLVIDPVQEGVKHGYLKHDTGDAYRLTGRGYEALSIASLQAEQGAKGDTGMPGGPHEVGPLVDIHLKDISVSSIGGLDEVVLDPFEALTERGYLRAVSGDGPTTIVQYRLTGRAIEVLWNAIRRLHEEENRRDCGGA